MLLEEVVVVFSKKQKQKQTKKTDSILYKYERTEQFYYSNNKQTIQLGGIAVSFTRKGENLLFSKLVGVGQRVSTDTSEYAKHCSLIC